MPAHPPKRSAASPPRPATPPPVDTAQRSHEITGRSVLIVDGFSSDFAEKVGEVTLVEMKRYSDADCQKLRELIEAYEVDCMAKHADDPAASDNINTAIRFLMVIAYKLQRDWIGKRIRAAKQAQKARGEYSGQRAPFGFAYDAKHNLVPDKKQQQTVRLIRKLYAKGRSPRKISVDLATKGIKLSHVTIAKIVRRPDVAVAQQDL